MTSDLYLERWHAALSGLSYRGEITPSSAVQAWRELIDQIVAGYDWSVDELRNDMAPRGLLEKLLVDPELEDESDVQELAELVKQQDVRFRGLIRGDVSIGPATWPWWRRAVLKSAGADYMVDIRVRYGIGDG